ncbi:MAG: ParB/RepB/Spo0J family partition protein [Oscillospiraceae bacterium]|jgi:ParB family chromosome partitioning protein|nr:ParB/RepB/Spo0J family partition protein [Oscillospiraceae bacterium]
MAPKKGGLGRGLDSLFEDNGLDAQTQNSTIRLRIIDIEPNRSQPRRDFDEEALAQLSASIAEHGVLQPIVVRPLNGGTYQIVAGERRWRASRLAGLSDIPVIVRELSDDEVTVIALIENLQREDLNPMEEALGYQHLMETCNLTQDEAAKRVGKSRPAVANALRLLKLPESVAEMVRDGLLSGGHARSLLPLDDADSILTAADEVVQKQLSVRETEDLARRLQEAQKKVPQTPKVSRMQDKDFAMVQSALEAGLGRKVRIQPVGGRDAGRIMIDFESKDDLLAIGAAFRVIEA